MTPPASTPDAESGAVPRPDASMDLLTSITRTAVDPDYEAVAGERPPRRPALTAVALALAAVLVTMAAAMTTRQAPVAQVEREQLIARVQSAEAQQDQARRRVATLDEQVRRAEAGSLPSVSSQQVAAEAMAGLRPVVGPGIVVKVDDAPAPAGGEPARVTDQDLRRLVNGLWGAGAEAIAINGHRLSSRTAIRGAGSAITVDYRSLGHPYQLEAIGDPRRLGSALNETPGGHWWTFLKDNYRLGYEVTIADELRLDADPGLGTRLAEPER
ncbi:DUF881 domain-containing protein [Luteococcus sediminum]